MTWLLLNIVLVPKTNVALVDRHGLQVRTVANVPIGVASFASISSKLGYEVSKILGQTMQVPNAQGKTVTKSFEDIVAFRSKIIEILEASQHPGIHSYQQA